MGRLSDAELRARTLAGLALELELFGSGSESASFLRLPGIVASVAPVAPERSVFNSVFASEPDSLGAGIDDLEARYERASVRAWTVWVPDTDRSSAALLARRGHVLDGAPRAMALELDDLVAPARPLPAGVELLGGDLNEVGPINDRAYGIEGPGWGAMLTRPPSVAATWLVAVRDGVPVACAGALGEGEDVCVTAVATDPEQQGLGLASHVLHALLGEAARRGARTANLQASAAGAPVYERLGFRDLGFIELWEKRCGA